MKNSLTQWTGASITLHEQDKSPDIYGKSLVIPPGSMVKLAVSREDKLKLPHPYKSDCVSDWPDDFPDDMKWISYQRAQCLEAAKQLLSMSVCNCTMTINSWNGMPELHLRNFKFCTFQDRECVANLLEGIAKGTRQLGFHSECKTRCKSTEYEV